MSGQVRAQCEVLASANPHDVVCGDCATLTAFGQAQGQSVFQENFDSGSPSGWAFTQQATFTNPCSPGGVDGTTHIWMGDQSAVPRSLETVQYDFTTATAGVTVCFDMLFAEQGDAAPCEGPDEPDEGVYLQYSTDGGATWTTINYFDPNGGGDPDLVNWNNWCFPLPPGAISANTQIRWFQDNDSGADYDHWGIDNVDIFFNDPTYDIVWQHDGYAYGQGNSGGDNPTPVCPQTDQVYTVTMSNGTQSCQDTVHVTVTQPTIEIDAGNDTTICPGDCATLNAEAKVVKRPAKTPTYENNELEAIATAFGQTTNININVQGLNMTNVLPGSITEVCINNLTFFGTNLFPPGQQTIGDLEIYLVCPDGSQITLVPSGVTTSTALQGYNQTCFTPASTNDIATGSVPYTGDWMPDEPFNNLAGCTANGVWSIEVANQSVLSFGAGTFFGWSITFDDPEISYTADFNWSPTTNMTGSNTLSPTVCPPSTQTYTLTASDTAGCVTVSDQVTVTVDANCCPLQIDSVGVTDATCGQSNGELEIFTNMTPATIQYSIDGGSNWVPGPNTFTGLASGSYTVIVQMSGNCFDTSTVTINDVGGPTIDNVASTDPTCGNSNGDITITATGATQYSIDNGSSFQGNGSFSNLSAGTYDIVVEDGNGCQATDVVTLTDQGGPTIDNVASTDPTCGNSNGDITITATGATQYSIDNGSSFQGNGSFTNLSAGTYDIVVEDGNGCQATDVVTLTDQGGPTIDNVVSIDPTCGNSNGDITITATGANQYSIDNGSSFQGNGSFSNLSAGTYDIVVEDGNGCQATDVVTLNDVGGPVIDSVVVTDATCGNSNGVIEIFATGAAQYSNDNGGSFQATNTFSNLAGGNYNIVVEDGNGCQSSQQVNVGSGNLVIDSIVSVDPACGQASGSITIYANGVTDYSIDNGATTQPNNQFNNLSAGTYDILVEDAQGCQVTDQVTLVDNGSPDISLADEQLATCGQNDGAITIAVTGGVAPYSYQWSNGVTDSIVNNLSPGFYSVTVNDQFGCADTFSYQMVNINGPQISFVNVTDADCEQHNGSATTFVQGGTDPYTALWSNGDNNLTANDLAPGTYSVTVTDSTGCVDIDTVTINAVGNINVSVTGYDASCGQPNGAAVATTTSTGTPFTFNWNNGGTTDSIGGLSPGTYQVTITDDYGCSGSDSTQIISIDDLSISLTATDATCGDSNGAAEVTVASGSGTAPYTYNWNNGATTATLNGLDAGTYVVNVSDANSCTAADSVTITGGSAPLLTLTATPDTCGFNIGRVEAQVTDGSAPYTYQWSHDSNLNGPVAESLPPDIYTVTIIDSAACTVSESIEVECIEPPEAALYVPNAFTPNGDGVNDVFYAYGSGISDIRLRVFNRWGELVFESNDINQGWDGTYNGKAMPPDVYVFDVKASFINPDARDEHLKGSITLLK